jgi:outer membrane lipoprotein
MFRVLIPLLTLLLLAGCSSKPVLPTEGANKELSAKQVVDTGEQYLGDRVLWGGVIVNSTNLEGRTRLEILSYPLGSELRPLTEKKAGNRFLAYHKGYLETVDYAVGRQVSLVGTISGIEEGQLGETRYAYPAVEADQFHLWPVEKGESKSRIHFGIGVIFSN